MNISQNDLPASLGTSLNSLHVSSSPPLPEASFCMNSKVDHQNDDDDLLSKSGTSKYVKLNVGGTLFCTTFATLMSQDTMLRAMFSGRMPLVYDDEGWILIDRSGRHFDLILNFLRDCSCDGQQSLWPLPSSVRELNEVLAEAKFYCIAPLVTLCESRLRDIRERELTARGGVSRANQPSCHMVLVKTAEEHSRLVQAEPDMPFIHLAVNRKRNAYSYVDGSDDLILKNIELFDKLCVRFASKARFHKNVTDSDNICRWTFYPPTVRRRPQRRQSSVVDEVQTSFGSPLSAASTGLPSRGQAESVPNPEGGETEAPVRDGLPPRVKVICLDCSSIVYLTGRKNTKVEFPEARILEATLNCLMFDPDDPTANTLL